MLLQKKDNTSLEPFKQSNVDFVTPEGAWEFAVAAHMKSLGMETLMKRGLNYRKALLLLGFKVDSRGRVTPPETVRRKLFGKQPPLNS